LGEIASYRRRHPLYSLYAEIHNPVFLHVMGEPLLHPQFFEIVRCGHELGLDLCLVTNASLLTEETTRRVLDSELSSLVLSLNAPDADSFAPTHSPIPFHRVVEHVQNVVAERYRRGIVTPRIEIQLLNSTRVNVPDCKLVENVNQVEAQVAFWSAFMRDQERANGATHLAADSNVAFRWQSVLEHHEANDPDTYLTLGENVFLVFKQTCNFANRLLPAGYSVRETQQGECPFRNAHRVLAVLWDGSCTFCSLDYDNEVNLGNVFEEGIDAIWSGERMNRIRALMEHGILSEPLCRRCMGQVVRGQPAGSPARFNQRVG
jgi:MoaA/NifB/PqqE/SkfB family radical SAM enzyme